MWTSHPLKKETNGPSLSCASAPETKEPMWVHILEFSDFIARTAQSQGSVTQISNQTPACAKCGKNHQERVVMSPLVASSVARMVISWESALKTGRVVVVGAIDPNLL